MKVFQISEMLWILHSSQYLEPVVQVHDLLSDFTVIQPVRNKELQKHNADLLESNLKLQVLFIFICLHRQHRSQLLYTIRRLLFFLIKSEKDPRLIPNCDVIAFQYVCAILDKAKFVRALP